MEIWIAQIVQQWTPAFSTKRESPTWTNQITDTWPSLEGALELKRLTKRLKGLENSIWEPLTGSWVLIQNFGFGLIYKGPKRQSERTFPFLLKEIMQPQSEHPRTVLSLALMFFVLPRIFNKKLLWNNQRESR